MLYTQLPQAFQLAFYLTDDKLATLILLTSLQPGADLKSKFLGSEACACTVLPPSELLSQGWSFTMYVHFASNSASGQSVISTPSMSIFMVCYVPSGRGDSKLEISRCCVAAWNTKDKRVQNLSEEKHLPGSIWWKRLLSNSQSVWYLQGWDWKGSP